jgi:parallel beta-helix repeat protein
MHSNHPPWHKGPLSATIALLLLAPAVGHGATYYVAPPPTGDDAAAGTETAPWATLQHAADTVVAGDEVVVADGIFIGFRLATTGTAAAPIVFRAAAEAAEVTSSFAPDGPGILLDGASWVTVEGFRITGSPAAGIQGSSTAGSLQGIVLRGNEVADCGASSGAACIVLVGANGSTIDSNVLHGCGGAGIELPNAETTRVENNIVYATGSEGILSYGGDRVPGPNDLVVVNNTVHVTSAGGWALRLRALGGIGTGNYAFDNILLAGETAAGSIALEGDLGFASARNATSDKYSIDDGGTTIAMAAFQASGYELGSLVSAATALFVDGSMGDYRLRAGCPAVNAGLSEMDGIPAAVLDIRGTRRPVGASWDLGAYEYCAGWTCDSADADADGGADADADADAAADVPHDGGGDSGCGCRAGGAGGGRWLLVLGCWSLVAGGRLLARRSGGRKTSRT